MTDYLPDTLLVDEMMTHDRSSNSVYYMEDFWISTLTVQTVLDYVFGRLDIAALDSTTNDHRIWMDDDIGLSLARNAYS